MALLARTEAPRKILAVERDPDMLAVLAAELGAEGRVEVRAEDAVHFDFPAAAAAAGRPVLVVGNLPYQITTALLFAIIDAADAVGRAIVMVQREFAERVVAAPGGKTYGRLSVMVQQRMVARQLFNVPPGAFFPRPRVVSAVLSLVRRPTPLAPVRDEILFARVVKEAFGTRRKMLRRSLGDAFGDDIAAALATERRRGHAAARGTNDRGVWAVDRWRRDRRGCPRVRGERLRAAMPELPEVETIARDLAATIVGARVEKIWGSGLGLRLARAVDLAGIRRLALSRSIVAVRRRAKYLLIEFDQAADNDPPLRPGVLIHLGMSGRLLVEPAVKTRPPHTHVAFTFSDGRELRFRDPRRFGWIAPGAPVDARPELAALGPDPLTELDAPLLAKRLAGVRAPIKAFLLDQRRIGGLGNIYACEALHRAGIHPTTPAGRVRGRATSLLAGIRAALELGIQNRGTTLRDYVDSFGAGGNNAASLRVYGREGQPCPICAAPVRRRIDSARSTFFCTRCQRR